MAFADRIAGYRERADLALERWLPPAATHPERFHSAIRYSVLGGGKRMRPLLVYAAAEWLDLPSERVDGIAVAIELVHAYSLVHHDLPALGDDRMRRSRATTHVAFDEATAILVGDALQAHAYYVLAADARLTADADVRRRVIVDLARASGSEGMAGGQALDMTPDAVPDIHERKAALFQAALVMPSRLRANAAAQFLPAAVRYGRALGQVLQMAEAPAAGHWLETLRAEAMSALDGCGAEAEGLRWLCDPLRNASP